MMNDITDIPWINLTDHNLILKLNEKDRASCVLQKTTMPFWINGMPYCIDMQLLINNWRFRTLNDHIKIIIPVTPTELKKYPNCCCSPKYRSDDDSEHFEREVIGFYSNTI